MIVFARPGMIPMSLITPFATREMPSRTSGLVKASISFLYDSVGSLPSPFAKAITNASPIFFKADEKVSPIFSPASASSSIFALTFSRSFASSLLSPICRRTFWGIRDSPCFTARQNSVISLDVTCAAVAAWSSSTVNFINCSVLNPPTPRFCAESFLYISASSIVVERVRIWTSSKKSMAFAPDPIEPVRASMEC